MLWMHKYIYKVPETCTGNARLNKLRCHVFVCRRLSVKRYMSSYWSLRTLVGHHKQNRTSKLKLQVVTTGLHEYKFN